MRIVVIGGTGLIGSRLVERLVDQGHEALPASPRTGVDTLTGEGLSQALQGAEVVVDVTNPRSLGAAPAMEFFRTSTSNLLTAEGAAHVRHHVVLSVVGTERLVQSSYFQGKLAQENLIEEGPIPYTIVRATQFFEFVEGIADGATTGNIVRLPPVLVQPVAAADVAAELARIAVDAPMNRAIEIAGPEQFRLDDLVRLLLTAANDPREVVADPSARYFGVELSERSLVPEAEATLGESRLDDWLNRR